MDVALIVTLCVIGGLLLIAFAIFGVQKTIGGIVSGTQFVVNEIIWGIPKTLLGSREREKQQERQAYANPYPHGKEQSWWEWFTSWFSG
ncbi:hypothetical protein NDN08_003046 [Rhodosorus marinus]|uniref:Uncharacterized protein n=1 Tax=Rhodosorus marinus TaxID=101924 RepID=A0AAV8UY47_9RHOD|nr:hypothetical protein NDN08_003046 [Rhodosorus marinus]